MDFGDGDSDNESDSDNERDSDNEISVAWLYLYFLVLACGQSLLPIHSSGVPLALRTRFMDICFTCMLMHAFATLVSFAVATVLLFL